MAWLWAASPCGCVLAELRRFGVDDLEKFDKRQGPEKESAPPGTRTPNPLIKSQLLCQLS